MQCYKPPITRTRWLVEASYYYLHCRSTLEMEIPFYICQLRLQWNLILVDVWLIEFKCPIHLQSTAVINSKYHTLYHRLPKKEHFVFFGWKSGAIPTKLTTQIWGFHAAVQCQWLPPKSYWLQLPWTERHGGGEWNMPSSSISNRDLVCDVE